MNKLIQASWATPIQSKTDQELYSIDGTKLTQVINVPPEFRTKQAMEVTRHWWNGFSYPQKEFIKSFYSSTHFTPESFFVMRQDLLSAAASVQHDWHSAPNWPETSIKLGEFKS